MPEYLAPGVYVEETSFRAKSIEGVSTSTTGFVGPTRKGPIGGTPEIITSFGDFQRTFGGLDNLNLADVPTDRQINYLALAVLHYFNEGGSRLYVSRCYQALAGDSDGKAVQSTPNPFVVGAASNDPEDTARFVARFPGEAGNGRVTLGLSKLLVSEKEKSLDPAPDGTLLRIVIGTTTTLFLKRNGVWQDANGNIGTPDLPELVQVVEGEGDRAEFLTFTVVAADKGGNFAFYEDLGFDENHPRWIGSILAINPSNKRNHLENTFALEIGANITAFQLHDGLFPSGDKQEFLLGTTPETSGNDGNAPITGVAGTPESPGSPGTYAAALAELEKLENISIVAAPGHSVYPDFQGIQGALIGHAEKRRAYRIAVLDTPPSQSIGEARGVRSRIDSKYAALYYPWVTVPNPLVRPGVENVPREIDLPPSGFICGIYARNDVERGVHKAPANERIRGALRFEENINFAQQEVLNPIGINCLRWFPNRGNRVWGARTVSSDQEYKYVNIRRYLLFLENSIDRGTQWAVFEPNGERLWANIRDTISSFLYNQWFSGSLLGNSPKVAYFVRCDRSTMTQNDLDNGRLVCLIGVSLMTPAEFCIFRIGQKTADNRN